MRRMVQPEIRSFVLLHRSPVTPFDSAKNANCFEECNVFGNGSVNLAPFKRGETKVQSFGKESAKLFANTKVQMFGKEKC